MKKKEKLLSIDGGSIKEENSLERTISDDISLSKVDSKKLEASGSGDRILKK